MMLNDFYNVVTGLDAVMDPRSKEKKLLCENYIKAWFGNLDETINFFNEHKVFSKIDVVKIYNLFLLRMIMD